MQHPDEPGEALDHEHNPARLARMDREMAENTNHDLSQKDEHVWQETTPEGGEGDDNYDSDATIPYNDVGRQQSFHAQGPVPEKKNENVEPR